MNDLVSDIIEKKVKINVWGAGYIGISTAYNFAKSGYRVELLDINSTLVSTLKKGSLALIIDSVDSKNFKKLIDSHVLNVSSVDEEKWFSNSIDIVCVDTERDGSPDFNSLKEVLHEIHAKSIIKGEKLLIIESTIVIDWIDTLINPNLLVNQHLAVAPRRDWFLEEGLNLNTLPRVIGVNDTEYECAVKNLYLQLSDNLIIVSDSYHAGLVKAVENSIRYINIVFANEMMRTFNNLNMSEIFEAAGTKWNIPTYHPSIGIGGYCLPLAPKYILDNFSLEKNSLPLLKESIHSNSLNSKYIVDKLSLLNIKNLGILGLSYAPDTKIWKNTPVIDIIQKFKELGGSVKINDPYYETGELEIISKTSEFKLNIDEISQFDGLLIATAHSKYFEDLESILENLNKKIIIIDNFGKMDKLKNIDNVTYLEIGNFNL